MDPILLKIALIGALGVGAQWLAWRLNLPAIVLMALAGLAAGPGLGWLDPATDFGELYQPMIAIAVAVILFDGGLSLNFAEIRGLSRGVRRMVAPGVFIAWGLGSLAAHYAAGLSWPIAVLFAGLLVVTGPTVITPLLRQAKLAQRPAALLKWEGIINDPIGALFAVVIYEYATIETPDTAITASILLASLLAILCGIFFGRGAAWMFRRGLAPEYLKPPIILTLVIVCFELANELQDEAGLIAVTAMGVAMANAKIAGINELRHFKESIAIVLVSGVFVMLTADLDRAQIAALDGRALVFVLLILFVVRPLTVWISTIGTGLTWQEKTLAGWIAPRGIVAVAVSSFFGTALVTHGFEDANRIVPLAFAVVFATVVLHGFTIGPLAKALGLATRGQPGVLIVGASPWSVALAQKLKNLEIPVLVADAGWRRLKPARQADVPTYYGEILSEVTEHHLDLNRYGYLLAVTGNEAYNALVCTDLTPDLGRTAVYQLSARGKDEGDRRALSFTLQGRTFLESGAGLEDLLRRHYLGWTFQRTRLSETYGPDRYLADLPEDAEVILAQRNGTGLLIASKEAPLKLEAGDVVLSFAPPDRVAPKEDTSAAAPKEQIGMRQPAA